MINDDQYDQYLGVDIALDTDTDFIGATERIRALTPSEEKAKRTAMRAHLTPAIQKAKRGRQRSLTPAQYVRSEVGKDAKRVSHHLNSQVVGIIKKAKQAFRDFQRQTQSAYKNGAITVDEAKRLISEKRLELNKAMSSAIEHSHRQAQEQIDLSRNAVTRQVNEVVQAKNAMTKDARIRELEQEKRQYQALMQQGQVPPETAISAVASIDEEISKTTTGGKGDMMRKRLRTRILDCRQKVVALQSAISQAEEAGADFVTFGEIEIGVDEAKNRMARHNAMAKKYSAKLAGMTPKKVLSRGYSPVSQDGSVVPLETLRAHLKFLIRNGRDDEAKKIRTIINAYDPVNGAVVKVRVYTVAIRENLPTGEKFVVTAEGSGRTQMLPVPNMLPSAVPYQTYMEEAK